MACFLHVQGSIKGAGFVDRSGICEAGAACCSPRSRSLLRPRILITMPAEEGHAGWASCEGFLSSGAVAMGI